MLVRSRRSNVPVKRSVLSALQFFGIDDYQPHHNVKVPKYYFGYHSFWMRHYDDLEYFANEIHQAVRARLKEVRTDMVENHEQAIEILEVYAWLKKQFLKRGVRL